MSQPAILPMSNHQPIPWKHADCLKTTKNVSFDFSILVFARNVEWDFLGIFKHHVQVKITCEKANFTQMDEVTHQLSKQNFQIKYFYIRQSEFPILYNDFFMDLDINHLSFFDSSKETQCLKITQNVYFAIFHQLKMSCLVTLFDRKL